MSRNITEIRLLGAVPLENDNLHTLYFSSKSEQTNYFTGKTKFWGSEFSYQRKENKIRYPRDFDQLTDTGVNYVMYKNKAYSDKWYYAFVTRMEYISDGVTDIYIETDVIQSYMFDINIRPSFIEREHTNYDEIGENTVPEGLETGEYKMMKISHNLNLKDTKLIMGTTVNINDEKSILDPKLEPVTGDSYNGLFSGVRYYVFDANNTEAIKKAIAKLLEAGQSDAITSLFIAPSCFVEADTKADGETYAKVKSTIDAKEIYWKNDNSDQKMIEKPTSLDGYTPRNKKLLTYPYTYLNMSNNAGANAIYRFEHFSPNGDNTCDFKIAGAITPGMSIRLIPIDYNGVHRNTEEGLNLGKFPICSWSNDVYTNWLTQTSINRVVELGSGVAMIAGGIAGALTAPVTGGLSLGATGGIIAGATMIGNSVKQVYEHRFTPPQASGNTNAGDVTYTAGWLTFTGCTMSIRSEYAKIIDEYFDMFGYKVNRLKVPSVNHRENYWYTKTIDINIDTIDGKATVPVDDMKKIKDCYNRGITFWKNPANIGRYFDGNGQSLSNKII